MLAYRDNLYHSGTITDAQFAAHIGIKFDDTEGLSSEVTYYSNVLDAMFVQVISDQCPHPELLKIGTRVCVKIPNKQVSPYHIHINYCYWNV